MEPFIRKNIIDYGENEILNQPAHTDVALLKLENAQKGGFQVKLSLIVTSTLSKKTGTTQIMLTRADQVALINQLVNSL